MKLFKSYTFTWWQMGIFKLALFCIGASFAIYFNEFFSRIWGYLIAIAIISSVYMMYIALTQK